MSSSRRAAFTNPRLLLFVPVAADMVFLYANPPAKSAVNPFFLYLVVFGVGVLLLSHLLVPTAVRLRQRFGPKIVFAGLGFTLSMVEEIVAYLTRSGIFQGNQHTLLFGLVQAGIPLFLWTLGVLLALQRFNYSRTQLFVLVGLSGWLCEAVLGGFLFREPFIALVVLPAVAYSYFVLTYLPYGAVEDSIQPRSRSLWRVPAMLVIPAVFWLAGGVVGFFLSRGLA